jgi:hypothetical protein
MSSHFSSSMIILCHVPLPFLMCMLVLDFDAQSHSVEKYNKIFNSNVFLIVGMIL